MGLYDQMDLTCYFTPLNYPDQVLIHIQEGYTNKPHLQSLNMQN